MSFVIFYEIQRKSSLISHLNSERKGCGLPSLGYCITKVNPIKNGTGHQWNCTGISLVDG